ncbi:uncharacterized protein LOC120359465 [Solenopsis invicta]|uniref:uncharacterized protein LOC120359465 n=1 Tax=Solenopsis invicta TaxID=13686 RepID=UPI00193DD153|nr:uncharacterized protein LOC120359465 [Solenopsis invicta]
MTRVRCGCTRIAIPDAKRLIPRCSAVVIDSRQELLVEAWNFTPQVVSRYPSGDGGSGIADYQDPLVEPKVDLSPLIGGFRKADGSCQDFLAEAKALNSLRCLPTCEVSTDQGVEISAH